MIRTSLVAALCAGLACILFTLLSGEEWIPDLTTIVTGESSADIEGVESDRFAFTAPSGSDRIVAVRTRRPRVSSPERPSFSGDLVPEMGWGSNRIEFRGESETRRLDSLSIYGKPNWSRYKIRHLGSRTPDRTTKARGLVVDEEGKAVHGAKVWMRPAESDPDAAARFESDGRRLDAATDTTGKDGHFAIRDSWSGGRIAIAQHPDFSTCAVGRISPHNRWGSEFVLVLKTRRDRSETR